MCIVHIYMWLVVYTHVYRRRYVATVGVTGLAGCTGLGSDDEGTDGSTDPSSDDPASPVVQHYEALDQNDFEAANAAIHSESKRKPLPDEAIDRARQMNYAIDSIETDTDGEYPVVTVTVTETNKESGDTNTLNLRIQVQRDDGDWKMFDILN